MNKDKIIYELFKLLDDIDTTSDQVKEDDKAYRFIVERLQNKRWRHIKQDFVDELYDKYYKKGDGE